MGILDSFKNVFGKSESGEDLAEASQDPVTAEPEEPAPTDAENRTYMVQSGDTLWKIAEEMYGDGSRYMKIFDANSSLLEHPDRIFPGQELTIPNNDD